MLILIAVIKSKEGSEEEENNLFLSISRFMAIIFLNFLSKDDNDKILASIDRKDIDENKYRVYNYFNCIV
jgi:hypothetical protein